MTSRDADFVICIRSLIQIVILMIVCTHIEEPSSEECPDALDDDVEDRLDEADLAPHEQPGRHRGVDVAT